MMILAVEIDEWGKGFIKIQKKKVSLGEKNVKQASSRRQTEIMLTDNSRWNESRWNYRIVC